VREGSKLVRQSVCCWCKIHCEMG